MTDLRPEDWRLSVAPMLDWTDRHYSVYAEVNNIFGKRYYDYGNVEQPGTWVMAGIKWQIF